ncbi:MAG TPA: methyltransferase [Ktedonobacterales bacterium]|nr:methyltransferase [Ktedonobacterales bacterium]
MMSDETTSATEPSPADLLRLQQLWQGFRVSQALYVAASLGLADLLADGPKSADALAAATGANADALYRVMRALASLGVFAETVERHFTLTPMARLLQQDHPYSIRAQVIYLGYEPYRAWGQLLPSVMSGANAYQQVFGMPHFQYLAQHPEANAAFNRAMSAGSRHAAVAIVGAYDFATVGTVVDIAGGQGVLIAAILRAHPNLRGILFDQPHVVADALPLLEAAGVADRCELASGDFFASVPSADTYTMRHILHDWDDERAIAILRSCAEAMAPDGRVLVIESVIEPGNDPSPAKFLDLVMFVMNGGRERTAEEFRRLFAAAGLRLTRIIPTGGAEALIEGERA